MAKAIGSRPIQTGRSGENDTLPLPLLLALLYCFHLQHKQPTHGIVLSEYMWFGWYYIIYQLKKIQDLENLENIAERCGREWTPETDKYGSSLSIRVGQLLIFQANKLEHRLPATYYFQRILAIPATMAIEHPPNPIISPRFLMFSLVVISKKQHATPLHNNSGYKLPWCHSCCNIISICKEFTSWRRLKWLHFCLLLQVF